MRADPIGLAGMDSNIYGYVLNDPVNKVDPYGLEVLLSDSLFGTSHDTISLNRLRQFAGGIIVGASGLVIMSGYR